MVILISKILQWNDFYIQCSYRKQLMKDKHSNERIIEIINKLRDDSIINLKGKDRQLANALLENPKYQDLDVHLYGVIDYRVFMKEVGKELHFIFFDVKNASVKQNISDYLIQKKITSYNLAGDMDIVINILSTRQGVEMLKKDIAQKYSIANIEFHTYVALRPLILEKKIQRDRGPDTSLLNMNPNIISRIQANYADESLKDEYNTLIREKVLVGHSVLYDFTELQQLRDFALIFNIHKTNESQFFKYKEISEHIIDLYGVDYIRPIGSGAETDYTSFYCGAEYLAHLEFSNSKERSTWEKMIGTVFQDSNVFFFPISNFTYQGPYGTIDIEFDERCNKYSNGDTCYIGNPVRNGDPVEANVGLGSYCINKNGFILGQPRVGKTTTALRLLECFINKKLTIYMINPTLDLVNIIKKDYGNSIKEHNIIELQDLKNGFMDFNNGIHIFYVSSSN